MRYLSEPSTRYFFLWFLLYNIYVRVFAPLHAPTTPPEGAWLRLVYRFPYPLSTDSDILLHSISIITQA